MTDGVTQRGKLRIYLGAAPGVGKTYSMLAEAQRRRARGTDVVVGLVETHGRRLTERMAEGLEVVPRRPGARHGYTAGEMDLDAILARHPAVVLVDEFAHSNAPGSRHEKRWEDVEDLLDAGIDVISTLNIQHLESLAEVVRHITGVGQHETVPDDVVRRADQVELVDMTSEALRRRLIHGNVYPVDRVDLALTHYFRPGNLTALRELALLWVADRVEEGLQRYRAEHGITTPWETRERILVALTGEAGGEALLHRAARIAERTPGSDLLAVHVVCDDGLAVADPAALAAQRRAVESLGGTYHRILGEDVADALVEFAATESITQLVLGAPRRNPVAAMFVGDNVGPRVIRACGQADVHIVPHDAAVKPIRPTLPRLRRIRGPVRLAAATLAASVLLVAFTVALVAVRPQVGVLSALPPYLIAVGVATVLGGLPVGLGALVVATLLADFFFTSPRHSFVMTDVGEVFAVAGFVGIGLLVTVLLETGARTRREAADVSAEAAALAMLAASAVRHPNDLPALLEQVRATFRLTGVSLLEPAPGSDGAGQQWFVLAGAGTDPPERPDDADVEVPLNDALVLAGRGRLLSAADRRVLTGCAAQIGSTVRERRLARSADEAAEREAADRTGGVFLQLVDRDLRAAITTARHACEHDGVDRGGTVLRGALDHLDRIATRLHEVNALRFGAFEVKLGPVDPGDVLADVVNTLEPEVPDLAVKVTGDLPDVNADPDLLKKVLAVLLARAAHRSPAGKPPVVTLTVGPRDVEIRITECRAPGSEDRTTEPSGSLGLAFAEELAEAMGATVRVGDGRTVTVRLPLSTPAGLGAGHSS